MYNKRIWGWKSRKGKTKSQLLLVDALDLSICFSVHLQEDECTDGVPGSEIVRLSEEMRVAVYYMVVK